MNDLSYVKYLCRKLDERERTAKLIEPYYDGQCPLPVAVTEARMTKAYRYLLPMADASWGTLVLDSVLDRLEPIGLKSGDPDVDAILWEHVWQRNAMDAESMLAHTSALLDGRAFAWVWPGDDGFPEISIETSSQMIVDYAPGFVGRKRVAALRRWKENGVPYAKLWTADRIVKFSGPKDYGWSDGIVWELVEEDENPYGVVPVVELAVNRRLKPSEGTTGYARGEFEHCVRLIDRINLLTFLGLVVALWMGFPLRGVIGDKILRDDDGEPIAPFDSNADGVFQLENPEAKLAEFAAADRRNLSIFAELDQLAVLTKTPRHYFPFEGGMSNISADTIRASEGALHAKVRGKHKPSLGEGWEEVARVAGLMLPGEVGGPAELPSTASLEWADHESRSLAEKADAYSKLSGLPWTAAAEIALNATDEQIVRWGNERANDPLAVLAAAVSAPPEPPPAP